MNSPSKRVHSCEGKERFDTFSRAQVIARRQARRRKKKFAVYRCHFCGGFHVGTHVNKTDDAIGGIDSRFKFSVYVRDATGAEFVFGWANVPDGGRVAQIARETPGLTLSCVSPRKPRTGD